MWTQDLFETTISNSGFDLRCAQQGTNFQRLVQRLIRRLIWVGSVRNKLGYPFLSNPAQPQPFKQTLYQMYHVMHLEVWTLNQLAMSRCTCGLFYLWSEYHPPQGSVNWKCISKIRNAFITSIKRWLTDWS